MGAMENYQLEGHYVRIVWRDFGSKFSNQIGATIFRGQVAHQDAQGLWLWGRFFLEKTDTRSIRELPREKDGENKMYYSPWISIDTVQIVPEGSRDYEVQQLVMARKNEATGTP
jgi:hypothetical protein